MKTILIRREDLPDGVRVVCPLHVDDPGDNDYLALDFLADLDRTARISINEWGIGENDGEVWTLEKIISARTK